MDANTPKTFAEPRSVALDDAIDGIIRCPELSCNILPQEGARECKCIPLRLGVPRTHRFVWKPVGSWPVAYYIGMPGPGMSESSPFWT